MKEELKKLVDRIIELPELIKQSETKIAALTLKHNSASEKLQNKESKIMIEICNETDAEGKIVYSNKEKRDAELSMRRPQDKDYLALNEELSKTDFMLTEEKTNLNFLINEFRMIRSVLQFMSRQIEE